MIQIELDDQVADALIKQAASRGLSLPEYLESIAAANTPIAAPAISAEELDRLLDDEASSDGTINKTWSRADIYVDHD